MFNWWRFERWRRYSFTEIILAWIMACIIAWIYWFFCFRHFDLKKDKALKQPSFYGLFLVALIVSVAVGLFFVWCYVVIKRGHE